MAIRNAAASAVLRLLFLSLVVIYLLTPQNGLVTFLSILILVVSLVVAQSRRWHEIAIMAVFAAIVSLVAASLYGRARFGDIGGVVALLIWGGILILLFVWTQRNMRPVGKDRAVLIRNQYTGETYTISGAIAPPLMPFTEANVAEIPLYELTNDVQVEKINTKRQNVDRIDVRIYYRVVDPLLALRGIPNRGKAQNDIAGKMNKRVSEARLEVTFWEQLLGQQMKLEVEDIVRDVIYDNVYAQNPLEVYTRREDLAELVRERLSELVRRWGVAVNSLDFERVDVNPDVMKSINKVNIREDETLLREIEAKREARRLELLVDAQVNSEAKRVKQLVTALQETGVDLSADDLREIVLDAIHASVDVNMETALMRPMLEGPAPKPAAGAKDNVAKK